MEDPIVAKRKEVTLTSDQIRKADPRELFELLENFRKFLCDQIKQSRFISMTEKERTEFHQKVAVEWGKWSHSFNKEIRQIIKEHELFIDNTKERFLTKQYATIYLFWWKCNNYMEAYNSFALLANFKPILNCLDAMDNVKAYFENMKIKELPTWAIPVSNQ